MPYPPIHFIFLIVLDRSEQGHSHVPPLGLCLETSLLQYCIQSCIVYRLYIKRQYPISSLTYCGADPNDTRWDFPQLQHLGESIPITNAPCFGVFTRLPDSGGHSCLLFAQYSPSQPVTSVLSYLHQVMRQRQRQN
jgi:hypothetical protein